MKKLARLIVHIYCGGHSHALCIVLTRESLAICGTFFRKRKCLPNTQ
jgi:hypothetical protein